MEENMVLFELLNGITENRILIAYFTVAENSGVDAVTSASFTLINGAVRFWEKQFKERQKLTILFTRIAQRCISEERA